MPTGSFGWRLIEKFPDLWVSENDRAADDDNFPRRWCEERSYRLVPKAAEKSDLLRTAQEELEISLHQNNDIRWLPPIVKFDFEVKAGKTKIDALEIQVSHGYPPFSERVNLDLREYETTKVEKGKEGAYVKQKKLTK